MYSTVKSMPSVPKISTHLSINILDKVTLYCIFMKKKYLNSKKKDLSFIIVFKDLSFGVSFIKVEEFFFYTNL